MKKVRLTLKKACKKRKKTVKVRDFPHKLCYDTNKINDKRKERGLYSMYKAIDIAKYVITISTEEGSPISNLQLQKILYYIQLHWLEKFDEPLFEDSIAAWQFGPVVPNVYYMFCGYGGTKIVSTYDVIINDSVCDEINPIIRAKRALYPWDLVGDTHRPGGAWDKTYENGRGDHKIISIDLIKKDLES